MTKEINNPKTNESPEENEEIKKVVVKPIEEPTRLYFSSPCLRSRNFYIHSDKCCPRRNGIGDMKGIPIPEVKLPHG